MKLLTQDLQIGGESITGPLPTDRFNTVSDVINQVLAILFPIALFILFIYLLWAGFDLTRNLGNPEIIKSGKAKITNAIIGIILLAVSYWIAQIATKIFF